jgi:hypothetical protein
MNSYDTMFLPLASPNYLASGVFWIASIIALSLVTGVFFGIHRMGKVLDKKYSPSTPKGSKFDAYFPMLLITMVVGLAAAMGVQFVMQSIVPEYAPATDKISKNIALKYEVTKTEINTPKGVDDITVDPATGNSLTRVDATVVKDGVVMIIPYHVTLDKNTGEPTLKSVIDSPASSIDPETLVRK